MLLLIGIIVALIIISVSFYKSFDGENEIAFKKVKRRDQREIEAFGKAGENYVSKYLNKIIEIYGGYVFNNFCFIDEKGYSTEIDHILITRGGVFVIETKTTKGTIKGDIDDERWKQIKEDYQDDKTIKNPIISNQKHINHLKRMFVKTPPKMLSIIVFPLARLRLTNCNNVFDVKDMIEYIENLTRKEAYSKEFVERIYIQLKDIKARFGISKEEHIENINRKFN